jgi:two-component system, sensor histidine kinase
VTSENQTGSQCLPCPVDSPAETAGDMAAMAAEIAALRHENAKLTTIRDALIRQVDRNNDLSGRAFNLVRPILETDGNVEKRIQRLARAMSEAKLARRQLQQAIDTIGEGFILYDRDDRIVLCNRRYRQIFPELAHLLTPGTHFGAIIRYAAEIGVVVESVTDPDAWIASRTASHGRTHSRFQQLLSDGRWVQISEQATEDGGKVTIISDITPFKRLEETRRLTSMAQQSDVLARTVASIAQGVIVFGDDGLLLAWNSQAAMLLNLPYVDMHSGINVRALLRLVLRHGAQAGAGARKDAWAWVTDPGHRPPLRLEVSYPGGRTISANFRDMPGAGFVVTMTDVTTQFQAARVLERSKEELEQRVQERTGELLRLNTVLQDEIHRHEMTAADLRRMRKAADEANVSKTQFLAAASHDILQPLNAARLYLFALETSPLIDPGALQIVDNISQALHSTESILSTLLDISKLDAGGYRPKITRISLGSLFSRLMIDFGPLADEKDLRLRVVSTTATVLSDERLLSRILQNFLANAVKYTDTGTVLLGVRRQGGNLSIEVHDTGPGIAEKDRDVIFQEFRRASHNSGEAGGLGLGLAIVRRAADLLNHPVILKSRIGHGTCFAVHIPASATLDPSPGSMNSCAVARFSHGERRTIAPILVLENDDVVGHAMTTLFDHWKMPSLLAPSYEAMLDVISEQTILPDLVIADFQLNGPVDGIDAILKLRALYRKPLRGILITADQSQSVRDRTRNNDIEYFSKPVKPAQLRAYLNHLDIETSRDDKPLPPRF